MNKIGLRNIKGLLMHRMRIRLKNPLEEQKEIQNSNIDMTKEVKIRTILEV